MCACVGVCVTVCDVNVCVGLPELSVEVETVFWLLCLASTLFYENMNSKSPHMVVGNFSGPTMLQYISLR